MRSWYLFWERILLWEVWSKLYHSWMIRFLLWPWDLKWPLFPIGLVLTIQQWKEPKFSQIRTVYIRSLPSIIFPLSLSFRSQGLGSTYLPFYICRILENRVKLFLLAVWCLNSERLNKAGSVNVTITTQNRQWPLWYVFRILAVGILTS